MTASKNPSLEKAAPFQPEGVDDPNLNSETLGDWLRVRGISPDGMLVFEVQLDPDQIEEFIRAVTGVVQIPRADGEPANDNVVVVTSPGPGDQGPKLWVLVLPRATRR